MITEEMKIKFAQSIAFTAYSNVEEKHRGSKKNSVDFFFRDMYRYEKKSTAAKVVVSSAVAAGTIIATVGTGGLALGALALIAAGKYTVSKAMNEFTKRKQKGRLRSYMTMSKESLDERAKTHANLLAEDVCRALPKSRVHLLHAKDIVEEMDLEKSPNINNCKEAVAIMQAAINFTHHKEKARGYLIPSLILVEDCLHKYKEFSDEWSRDYKKLENTLVHNAEGILKNCSSSVNELYQSEPHRILSIDEKPTERMSQKLGSYSGSAGKNNFGKKSSRSIDIDEVMESLNKRVEQFLQGIDKYQKLKLESVYEGPSAGEAKFYPVFSNGPEPRQIGISRKSDEFDPAGARRRYKCLQYDLHKHIENPGRLTKIKHRFKNWKKATSRGEKVKEILDEGLTMGTVIAGVFLSDVIGKALKSGAGVAKTAASAGKSIGMLAVNKGGTFAMDWVTFRYGSKSVMMESGLLTCDDKDRQRILQESDQELSNSSKVVSEKLIKKTCHHFKKAIEARKKLGGQFKNIVEYAMQVYEVHHHMDKMERYLMACLTLNIIYLEELDALSESEKSIHEFLDLHVAPFVYGKLGGFDLVGDHPECKRGKSVCYGPKSDQEQYTPRKRL